MDRKITFFRYSGTSIPETEIIYHIISSSLGSVEEEKITPIESRVHTVIEIHFPIPYGDEFFIIFGADRWLKLRNVIAEIKKRRGRSEMQILFSFPVVSKAQGAANRLIFQTLETDHKVVERAVDTVQILIEAIESQMSKFPYRVLEMTFCYESARSRWRPDFAKTDERTYRYANGNWRV